MASKIQIRRDTASNWTSANPTLNVGEFGYETDTSKLKIGDGSTAWTSLSYILDPDATIALNDLNNVSDSGAAPGDVLTKQSNGYAFETPFDGSYNSLTNTPTLFDGAFSSLTSTPTTLSGYGITDDFDGAYSSLTSTPTTLSGYGITDAFDGAFSSLTSTPTTLSGYGITDDFDGAYSSLTNIPTIPSNLNDISDVSDSGATTGQVLAKQSDNTYAFETPQTTLNLSGVGDVSTSDATTGAKLKVQADSTFAFEADTATVYRNMYVFTALSGQTNFIDVDDNGNIVYFFTSGQPMVFLNGGRLQPDVDYTENTIRNGITLTNGANSGDILHIITWESEASEAYSFGGTSYGFVAGGSPTPSGIGFTIQKFPFSTFTTADDVGDLEYSSYYGSAQLSDSYGYVSGGIGNDPALTLGPGVVEHDVIQKYPFATPSDGSTDIGNILEVEQKLSGNSSASSGYVIGGQTGPSYANKIQKFPFASDAFGTASSVGTIGTLTYIYGASGNNSGYYGYITGGYGPGTYFSEVRKFSFSSDGDSTDVGNLTVSVRYNTTSSSEDDGFSAGGNSPNTDVIDKFPFASDWNGTSTNVGSLTATKYGAAGVSSTSDGYYCGGYSVISQIEKYPFSISSGTATDVGDLVSGSQYGMGHQY